MENKNPATEKKKDLKHADKEKFGNEQLNTYGSNYSEYFRKDRKPKDKQEKKRDNGTEKKPARKIPLAVDIIVAVCIILIVVGLIVGVYFAFKYFSGIRYKDAYVEYTSLIITDNLSGADIASLNEKEVYLDTENNSFYLGKIVEAKTVELSDGKKQVTVKIGADAQYKKGEGFSVSGNRIAVGCEYTLRYESTSFDIVVVEMYKGAKK